MFYYIFVFLLCLFKSSGTTVSTKNKDFYIDGYDSSKAKDESQTGVIYEYKENELLDISCHHRQHAMKIKWLQNEKIINGTEVVARESKLQFNISKSTDKYILTCQASEDTTDLDKYDKIVEKKINVILRYVNPEATTTSAPKLLEDNTEEETLLERLMKNTLFWTVVAVVTVVIILAAILAFASKKRYRIKEDKVGLNPADSNTSVFTTGTRAPTFPHHKITEDNVDMHFPISSVSYFNTDSRTLPMLQHTMTSDKVRIHPVSSASFYNTDSRILPISQRKVTNDTVGLVVFNVSYLKTDPRKPPIAQNNIPEECFYTNYDYNKRPLHSSRETIDEYQEPIDSQAYSYVQPQLYSEPEKQFYIEPVPKLLRKTNETAYVNYNKSIGSANINNKNIDLYQNCGEICDNEFDYYTETS